MQPRDLTKNEAYHLFQRGSCGIYALALHDLSQGKLALGIIYGERPDAELGDDVQVNVHSFVFHPENSASCLDSEGEQILAELMAEWQQEHPDNYYVDIEECSREEFLRLQNETGTKEIDAEIYQQAVHHIKQNAIVMKYLLPLMKPD